MSEGPSRRISGLPTDPIVGYDAITSQNLCAIGRKSGAVEVWSVRSTHRCVHNWNVVPADRQGRPGCALVSLQFIDSEGYLLCALSGGTVIVVSPTGEQQVLELGEARV
jgi:hypothetical protein